MGRFAFFTVWFYGFIAQAEKTVKTWEKTRLQNLVCHKSGGYYARLFRNGKEIWKPLKTSHFSVAEARMAAALKEHRERKGKKIDPSKCQDDLRAGGGPPPAAGE